MTEYQFIARHKEKWTVFESELKRGTSTPPDRLCELYVTLIDDLSYARTHFRESSLTRYLNQLATSAHRQIYGTRKERKQRIGDFFRYEVPAAFWEARRFFKYATLIFIGAIVLGWLSGALEPEFLRLILGDEYVNQTLENVRRDDPMGIYGSSGSHGMFIQISMNNVRVAVVMFMLGIFGGIPTVLLLLYNGVMVGAFLQFFAQHGLIGTAVSTIMLHGAMELTAIVVAGACGLMLGSAVLFPGTYARGVHVIAQARNALKIVLGVVPFILIAALIESYITRLYQDISDWMRVVLILGTFILMLLYLFSGRRKTTNESTV
jgi:uncharacterized membrane protein SpoIIM required for sporulation